jgi:hypothetical protein
LWLWEAPVTEPGKPQRLPRRVCRLTKVNLTTGEGAVVCHYAISPHQGWVGESVAASDDGSRLAWIGREAGTGRTAVFVREPATEWTPITVPSDSEVILPTWSRDGTAVLCLSESKLRPNVMDALALRVPHPPAVARADLLVRSAIEITQSADGRLVYIVTQKPATGECEIVSLTWPALDRRTLTRAHGLGHVSEARDTGELAFVAPGASAKDAATTVVCRLRRGSKPSATAVVLRGPVHVAEVSPDFEWIAVARADVGPTASGRKWDEFAVYSVESGASEQLAGLSGKRVDLAEWVTRDVLLVVEGGERVWLVSQKGEPGGIGPLVIRETPVQLPSADQQSLYRLAMLWQAVAMYTTDNAGTMPRLEDGASAYAELAEYAQSPDILVNPHDGEFYGVNTSLSHKKITYLRAKSDTILFYERRPRAGGQRSVVFLDGRVCQVSADEWRGLRAGANKRTNRPAG